MLQYVILILINAGKFIWRVAKTQATHTGGTVANLMWTDQDGAINNVFSTPNG